MPVYVNQLQEKMKMDDQILEILVEVVKTALKSENRNDDPEVSIALVDDDYIKELNYKYRHIDSPTDVLSFPMEESTSEEPLIVGDLEAENMLGDIIISVETALKQSEDYGHSFLREMAYLTAHGILHLLGYDHNNKEERSIMRQKEEQVLSTLEIMR